MASRDLETRFTGDTTSLDQATARARGDLQKVGSSFSSAAGGIAKAGAAIGVAFAVDKVLEFGTASLGIAVNLEESMSKVRTVFGDAAADMESFVEDANRLNLSDVEAAQLAGDMGNLARQLGLSTGDAADLTKEVTTLAADLGSFHNLDTADVMGRIQKAMTGELDGVKALAPALNAAAVEQRALADTGKDSAAQLTAQDKALATYALLVDQSASAIGDLDRTSDSAANKQKNLNSQMADAQAQLGQKLLPAWNGFLNFILEDALPGLQQLAAWFQEVVPPWYSEYVKPTVDAIVDVVAVAVELLTAFWRTFGEDITRYVAASFGALMTIIQGAMQVIKGIIDVVLGVLTGDWSRAWNGLIGIVRGVRDIVLGIVREFKAKLGLLFGALGTVLSAPFHALIGTVRTIVNAIARLWNRTVGALEFKAPAWVPGLGGKGFEVPDISPMSVRAGAPAAGLTVVMPEGASGYSLTTTLRQYARQGGNTSLARGVGRVTAIAWPDPPTPGPPAPPGYPAGTPGLADGHVFVQVALARAPYVWGGDASKWKSARWGVLTPERIEDATCDVLGCSIQRGRTDPLEHYAPARFDATLQDPLRRWGPASMDETGLRPMRVGVPLRVIALDLDDEIVPLFAGTVSAAVEIDDGTDPPIVSLSAIGTLGSLEADRVVPPSGGGGELAGVRMQRVLAASNYRADWWGTDLADGVEPLLAFDHQADAPDPNDPDEGTSALELLELVADSDGGSLLEGRDGTIVYAGHGDLEARGIRFRFTDAPSSTSDYDDVCPAALTFRTETESVVNAVAVKNADDAGTWLRAEDPVSISWTGRRPVDVDGMLFTNAGHGQRLAEFLLARAIRDQFQVNPIQGEALTLPGWYACALHLEVGDPVGVIRNDHQGTYARIVAVTQSKRHDITRRAWAVEVGLGAAVLRTSFPRWGRSSRWGKARWASTRTKSIPPTRSRSSSR